MKKEFCFFFLAVLLLSMASCKDKPKKVVKTKPIVFTKEGELKIHHTETDSIIAQFDIEIAETEYETQTGLMYRNTMEDNQGMLFIFPDVSMHSFYMKNTEIPLDIIFIDENLNIASFQKNATPLDERGLSSKVPIKYVLEINAGLSDKLALEIGNTIAYSKQ